MKEYIESLAEKYKLPLVLGNNQKKGYHIILNIPKTQRKSMKKSDLPDEFIEINRCLTFFTMKTPQLVNISTRIDNIMMDIIAISNVIIHNVVTRFKKHIYLFHTLCEDIAQLDVYQSLAQTSLENKYVRPKFGVYTEIKFGHHPLLNFLLPTKPIPNSIFCSDEYNVHVVNGPNGSGKSIFIRQVMLLQIMAQLGCYIPAQSAIFKPANQMFARIYLEDNMEYNASSFVLEMKEMKYIMSSMTDDSLVIIDELGRSTSVEEGMSLAIAILEYLACFSSYIYITTHFTTLSKLHQMYPNIKTWQMETIPIGSDPKTFKLDYRYNLIPGITSVARYGMYIVRNIWPDEVVANIDRCFDKLDKQQRKFSSLDPKLLKKYHLESELKHLKRLGSLSVSKIKQLLAKYQTDLKELNYDFTIPSEFNNLDNSKTNIGQYEISTQEILQEEEALKEIFTPLSLSDNDCTWIESAKEFDNSKSYGNLFIPDDQSATYLNNHHGNNTLVSETNMFNFCEPSYYHTKTYKNNNNSQYSNDDSDFIKLFHPIVTIEETEPQQHENVLNSSNVTYLSSIVSPDEYQSICDEFNKEFEPPESAQNLDDSIKQIGSPNNIMSERNTYKYYVSPIIVKIKEGLNNVSSFEDDEPVKLSNSTNNKIRIISDIVIKKKNDLNQKDLDKSDEKIDSGNNSSPPKNEQTCMGLEKSFIPPLKEVEIVNSQSSLSNKIIVNAIEENNLRFTSKEVKNCEDSVNEEIKIGTSRAKKFTKYSSPYSPNTSKEVIRNIEDNESDFPSKNKGTCIDLDKSVLTIKKCENAPKNSSSNNKMENFAIGINNIEENNEERLRFTSKEVENVEKYEEEIKSSRKASYCSNHSPNNSDNNIEDNESISTANENKKSSSSKTHSSVSSIQRKKKKLKLKTTSVTKRKRRSLYSRKKNVSTHFEENEVTNKKIVLDNTMVEKSKCYKITDIFPENRTDNDTSIETETTKYSNIDSTTNEITGDFKQLPNNSSTDLSIASKLRKLDQPQSETTSAVLHSDDEIENSNPYPADNNSSSNISSTSRKRNLDQATETGSEVDESKFSSSAKQNSTDDSNVSRKINHEITDISSASRKRNLDGSSSKPETTSPFESTPAKIVPVFKKNVRKTSLCSAKKINLSATLETSISSASKNRNLDLSSNTDSNSLNNNEERKYKTPEDIDTNLKTDILSKVSETNSTNKKRQRTVCNKRFIPPRKLTAKQIKEEFAEQDRKLLESEFDLTKYVEHKFNRPTVRQIQNATQLATIKKTPRGFEVIPSFERTKRQTAMIRTYSNETFNMSIFSDRNAKTFEQFMNSKETDFTNFPFNTGKQEEKLTFSFGQNANDNVFNYCMDNGTKSYDQNGINISLTPNGYYKQNKSTVDAVMNKYLNPNFSRGQVSGETKNLNFNLFGVTHLTNEDLDL